MMIFIWKNRKHFFLRTIIVYTFINKECHIVYCTTYVTVVMVPGYTRQNYADRRLVPAEGTQQSLSYNSQILAYSCLLGSVFCSGPELCAS